MRSPFSWLKATGWGLALLVLLGGCQPGDRLPAATYLTTIPDPRLLGSTYVSNPDLLLDAGTVRDLNQHLDSLDRSSRAHIDVVLVNTIGDEVPKTAATALFNKWQIGRADTDKWLLLLLVIDQHRIEIETGYGLEADLPDITCYRIEQDYMLDAARAGNYNQAVTQGVAALEAQLRVGPATHLHPDSIATEADSSFADHVAARRQAGAESLAAAEAAAAASESAGPNDELTSWGLLGRLVVAAGALGLYLWLWHCLTRGRPARTRFLLVPFAGVIGLMVLALGFRLPATLVAFAGWCYGLPLLLLHGYFGWQWGAERQPTNPTQRPAEYLRRQRAHRGLDFTAWLYPALLALYWPLYRRRLRQLRETPPACPTCAQPTQQLDTVAELPYLDNGQQSEQNLAAVDYDVWVCANEHRLLLPYFNPDHRTGRCPACHYRTYRFKKFDTIKLTSTRGPGWGWVIWRCAYCQHQQKRKWVIPRLPAQPPGGSSRRSSSSWSSSSSSSWGSSGSSGGSTSFGGSSGGGGAGSSW